MTNKVRGTKFENELCTQLNASGFWCRPMYPAPDGSQPFDVMAINSRGVLYCFECKDCLNDVFQLKRIEANQEVCLRRLMCQYKLENKVLFAFNMSDNIYILNADIVLDKLVEYMFNGKNSKLDLNFIKANGVTLENFIKENK